MGVVDLSCVFSVVMCVLSFFSCVCVCVSICDCMLNFFCVIRLSLEKFCVIIVWMFFLMLVVGELCSVLFMWFWKLEKRLVGFMLFVL